MNVIKYYLAFLSNKIGDKSLYTATECSLKIQDVLKELDLDNLTDKNKLESVFYKLLYIKYFNLNINHSELERMLSSPFDYLGSNYSYIVGVYNEL